MRRADVERVAQVNCQLRAGVRGAGGYRTSAANAEDLGAGQQTAGGLDAVVLYRL
jgi:hypothetical protein